MRLIDADALMRTFAEYVRRSNNSDFAPVPTWNDAVSLLGSAPTIEERKVGKWIEESQYVDKWGDTIEILKCPICGFEHDYCQGDTGLDDKTWFNYCPNCGAKMEGNT